MATLIGTGSTLLASYIPDLGDAANIQTALKQLYYGTTAGTLSQTVGVYGALYTLYSGNPTLAGNVAITGTLGVTSNTTLTGDLAVNGGDITTTATTFNIVDATATTLNIGGAATTLNIGATTGTTTFANSIKTRSGTATAGTAPLYFGTTTPTLLTTAVAGAMEFNGTSLFFTPSTTRKTVAFLESPAFTTPSLGVATATTINKVSITSPATSATLTIANGKTLTANNTIILASGSDTGTYTFPAIGGTVLTTNTASSSVLTSVGTLIDLSVSGAITMATTSTGSFLNNDGGTWGYLASPAIYLKQAGGTLSNGNVGIEFHSTSAGSDTVHVTFSAGTLGSKSGSISTLAAGGTSYSTTSDYRLKENIVPLVGAAERLLKLKPLQFNFIDSDGTLIDGFLAHEVMDVIPGSVQGLKDGIDNNGKPYYQSLDASKLIPVLTGALQEAIAEISSLKARIIILENK